MQLHQLLRFIHSGSPIILFDIQGIEILRVRTKESIPVDLNEYEILEVGVGYYDLKNKQSAFYISLQK